MPNGYIAVDTDRLAQDNPHKINFNWFNEAWALFSSHSGIWVPAVAITIFGPGAIDAYVAFAIRAAVRAGTSVAHPHALVFGVGLFNVIFAVYMLNGLGNLAVRMVGGVPSTFSDIFSGSRNFAGTLLWLVTVGSLTFIGSLAVIAPGILIAGLMLPSLALVTSGRNILESIGLSARATKNEYPIAMAMAFVVGLMIFAGLATGGLALLITLPIALLISALAYRDLIGLPGRTRVTNPSDYEPDTQLEENVGIGPRVSLTGESLDDSGNGD